MYTIAGLYININIYIAGLCTYICIHTHTHIYTYICVYVYICVCIAGGAGGFAECRPYHRRGRRGGVRKRRQIQVITTPRRQRLRSSRTSCRDGDAVRPSRVCRQLVAVPVAKSDSPKLAVKDRLDSIAYPSSIYALNMCSLAKSHAKDQLHADLLNYNIDIAIISETHLKRHHKDEIFAIEGYHLFRRDRIGRRNGGVAIYAKHQLSASICTITGDRLEFELLWLRVDVEGVTAFVGALYHPPTPIYPVADLMDHIEASLDELLAKYDGARVVLGGDLNKLNISDLSARTGLIPLVHVPTRQNKIIDMLMVSPPAPYFITVINATVKTDHRAIVATIRGKVCDHTKTAKKRLFRRRTPGQHANLLLDLRNFDDSILLTSSDPQEAWDTFYQVTHEWLDFYYPLRAVTLTSREPSFMTPEIRYLLRRKSRL